MQCVDYFFNRDNLLLSNSTSSNMYISIKSSLQLNPVKSDPQGGGGLSRTLKGGGVKSDPQGGGDKKMVRLNECPKRIS